MSHSPGPWRWNEYRDGELLCLESADGKDVMVIRDGKPPCDADEFLIALAPEMAELLRALEWEGMDYSGADTCPSCDAYRVAGAHAMDCKLASVLARLTTPSEGKPG